MLQAFTSRRHTKCRSDAICQCGAARSTRTRRIPKEKGRSALATRPALEVVISDSVMRCYNIAVKHDEPVADAPTVEAIENSTSRSDQNRAARLRAELLDAMAVDSTLPPAAMRMGVTLLC